MLLFFSDASVTVIFSKRLQNHNTKYKYVLLFKKIDNIKKTALNHTDSAVQKSG